MDRTRFIEHKGKRILLLDYSGIQDTDEALAEIDRSREVVAGQPKDKSLLTLVESTGARYNPQILEALKDLAAHNEPYVKASAVVTRSAMHRAAARIVSHFTGRTLQGFESIEDAKDWLVTQA